MRRQWTARRLKARVPALAIREKNSMKPIIAVLLALICLLVGTETWTGARLEGGQNAASHKVGRGSDDLRATQSARSGARNRARLFRSCQLGGQAASNS